MLKTVWISLFCSAFIVSSAHAGILDPLPLSGNISEGSPGKTASSDKTSRNFFYLLSKNFYNESDKIAAQTILLEALGEGYSGMVAVGEVIRNREKLFQKNTEAVCLMPKQFSAWNDASRAEEFLKKYRAYHFIALCAWIQSRQSSFTHGATDYHTVSIHPYWADAYHVAARLRNHIFYRRTAPSDDEI